jgi:hypothetical protein
MSLITRLFRHSEAPPAGRRVTLDDASAEAVRVLAESSLAGTWARMSRAPDEAGAASLADAEEALAEAVVRHALSVPGAPSADEVRARASRHLERVRAVGPPARILPERLAPMMALVVEGVLRRAGLEACDRYVELIVGRRGRLTLEARAVEPWVALGLLELDALSRAARWAEADPLLDVEMEAAHWWFDRWSAPATDADFGELRRMYVRTQEWALADRAAAAFREPVVARLLRERAHQGWPARQREVVERLPGSVVGVFTAREIDGAGAGVAVSAEDGRELALLYDTEGGIQAGDLLIGRLLPFGDGRWFGSAGMEAVSADEVSAGRLLDTFRELRETVPEAAALEGALTRHVYGRTAPRPVPPAEDPDEALRRLAVVREALGGRLPEGGTGPEEIAAALRSTETRGDAAAGGGDEVLAAWVEALMELVRKRVPGHRFDPQPPKRKAKKGKRR